MILYEFVKSLSHFFVPKKRQLPLQRSLCRTGASHVPTVVRNYRFKFLRLAKDCKGLNHINNSQKIEGIANATPCFLGGEQGTRLTSFAEKFATQTVLLYTSFDKTSSCKRL